MGTTSLGIPYPENTDLVKDGAADMQALAEAANDLYGLVHINRTTFSAVSAVSFNNVFSSTYDNYTIAINGLSGSGATFASIRLRVGGVDASGANYNRQFLSVSGTGITATRSTGLTTFEASMRYDTADQTQGKLFISNPAKTNPTSLQAFDNQGGFGTGVQIFLAQFNHTLSTAYDGFTIIAGGGTTITGDISVYGWRK